MVLQSGVLRKEIAAAFVERNGELLVVPERRELFIDLLSLRNRWQVIEGQLVLRLDPFLGRFGVDVLQGAIRIGHLCPEIVVSLLALWRLRINKRLISCDQSGGEERAQGVDQQGAFHRKRSIRWFE